MHQKKANAKTYEFDIWIFEIYEIFIYEIYEFIIFVHVFMCNKCYNLIKQHVYHFSLTIFDLKDSVIDYED